MPRSYRARQTYKATRFALSLVCLAMFLVPVVRFNVATLAALLGLSCCCAFVDLHWRQPDLVGRALGICLLALDVYNGQPLNQCTATTCGLFPGLLRRVAFVLSVAWFRGFLLGSTSIVFTSNVSTAESAVLRWIASSTPFAPLSRIIQWLWYRIETDDDASERLTAVVLFIAVLGGVRERPSDVLPVVPILGHLVVAAVSTAMLRKRFVRQSLALSFVAAVAFLVVLVLACVLCLLFLPAGHSHRDDDDGIARFSIAIVKAVPQLIPRNWFQGIVLLILADAVAFASRAFPGRLSFGFLGAFLAAQVCLLFVWPRPALSLELPLFQ